MREFLEIDVDDAAAFACEHRACCDVAKNIHSIVSQTTTMAASRVKRRRDPLSPKPILDRKTLVKALKERGISIKDIHLDTFYQLLHRQHYPDLKTFVEDYYRRESDTRNNRENGNSNAYNFNIKKIPTKNAVSSSKGNVRKLPKAFLAFLADPENDFVTVTSTIDTRPTSKDGTTTKMAIKLQDGHVVESVLMRHVSAGGSRATLCVSSQVGCAMGCTFCATGTMGFRGNLCTGEILEQLVHAGRVLMEELSAKESNADQKDVASDVIVSADGSKQKKSDQSLAFVRNIVFMGMGEPLNNYENVLEACRGMIDRRRWNLAHGRVTVSTVGVTPIMRRLTKELPEVNLALSLHAPNQPMREAIVPTAKMYPIQDMVDALDDHMMSLVKAKSADGTFGTDERKSASKRKKAMIEYVMRKFRIA
jgi:adenine C2-methylase RlmN of 23S rRNA A2503 and tRNA A37